MLKVSRKVQIMLKLTNSASPLTLNKNKNNFFLNFFYLKCQFVQFSDL